MLAAAISVYPGGNAIHPQAKGHSFWLNFLCDLTNDVASNGLPNTRSQGWARTGMTALAVALEAFWLLLPTTFPTRIVTGRVIRWSGTICVSALLLVPVVEGPAHKFIVFASVIPGTVAGALGLASLFATPGRRGQGTLAATAFVVSIGDAVLYAQSYRVHPRVIVPELPALQRVALLLMWAWMVTVAVGVLRSRQKE